MKYLIPLVSFIFIFSIPSFGQFQKGTWTINANSNGLFAFSEYHNKLSLSTDIGYFPTKWLMLGTEISYSRSKVSYRILHDISPNPYVRFYLNPDKKTKFYGQIGSDINLFSLRYRSSGGDSGLAFSRKIFRPEFGIGFNSFITKNVAFEGGISTVPSTTAKFNGNPYQYEYYNYPLANNGALIIPHFGIRLFLNTADEEDDKSPIDYLQARNYTVGLFGTYMHQMKTEYSLFSSSLNLQYFVAEGVSVGASVQLVSDGNNTITGVAPIIECYVPTSDNTQFIASASVNFFSEYLPTTYNFGFKMNTFVESNISLWAGPFVLNTGGIFTDGWRPYIGAGANYFIADKEKERSKISVPHMFR